MPSLAHSEWTRLCRAATLEGRAAARGEARHTRTLAGPWTPAGQRPAAHRRPGAARRRRPQARRRAAPGPPGPAARAAWARRTAPRPRCARLRRAPAPAARARPAARCSQSPARLARAASRAAHGAPSPGRAPPSQLRQSSHRRRRVPADTQQSRDTRQGAGCARTASRREATERSSTLPPKDCETSSVTARGASSTVPIARLPTDLQRRLWWEGCGGAARKLHQAKSTLCAKRPSVAARLCAPSSLNMQLLAPQS